MYSKKFGGNIAKACTHNARISVKNAKHVCRAVRGLYLKKAKEFLQDVLKEKRSINGKYYTKSVKEVLKLINSAEKNAEFKNMDLDNVYIVHIAALKGTTFRRLRHKRTLGNRMKTAHLEIILKERGAKAIKQKEKVKEEGKVEEKKMEKEGEGKVEEKGEKKEVVKESKKESKEEKKEKEATAGKETSEKSNKTNLEVEQNKDGVDNKTKNTKD